VPDPEEEAVRKKMDPSELNGMQIRNKIKKLGKTAASGPVGMTLDLL
jgi:hypothetical protein